MSTEKLLYVPIKVDAWVVNNKVINPPDFEHLPRFIRRWSDPYTSSFSTANLTFDEPKPGVYLHWTLPNALRHSEKATNAFPLLPNRWLIVKLKDSVTFNSWVVESDYCHPDYGTAPFQINTENGVIHTKIGRSYNISEGYKASTGPVPFRLTATANGDVTFSMFQPLIENVFSYYDDCQSSGSNLKELSSYM